MTLQHVLIRIPIREQGAGKTGYMLATGDAEGNWRVTEKDCGVHQLVASCDTPSAFRLALVDHVNAWLAEQETVYQYNLRVIASWPEVRPGWRHGWKAKERTKELAQMERARKSHRSLLEVIDERLTEAGWN